MTTPDAAQREMASNAAERDAAEAILDQVLKLDPSVKAYRVKIGLLIKRATDLAELVPCECFGPPVMRAAQIT